MAAFWNPTGPALREGGPGRAVRLDHRIPEGHRGRVRIRPTGPCPSVWSPPPSGWGSARSPTLTDTSNVYSPVVAVLADVVGIVSLTHARTSTLLGVFIAVTTIRAASDIAVAVASGSWSEARGSLLQLLLNVVLLIVVGLLTLRFVRLLWRRIRARRDREGK